MVSDTLREWLQARFAAVWPTAADALNSVQVTAATNLQFGDYQCNDAMSLAKQLRKPPRAVAEAVVTGSPLPPFLAKAEVAGPGFINLRLADPWLAEYLGRVAGDPSLGIPPVGAGRTIVLDYSSPNVAKPMHIGHIRSTIIGNALDRLHRCLGYRVISDNHIGDWGTQFGILMMGYRHFLDREALARDPVEELERLYVRSYQQSKDDPAWMEQCRQELVKLQSGDAEHLALWQQFVALSLKEFERIYARLDVHFDLVRGESFYRDRLAALVEDLKTKGLAELSEGAWVVFIEKDEPPCIVMKRDGGFNYATTDIATVISREEEFHPEKIIYVTDVRQQLHFRQFFAICRRLGYTTDLQHVGFGLMRLPEGTFSTREGNVIKLERLLDEAERKALEIVRAGGGSHTPEQEKEIARVVGLGAVKYADLSQNPQTTVTFSWEKAMALDGNSAPYLQYAYARVASVRDKYLERFPGGVPEHFPIVFTDPVERTLGLQLVRFPEIVVQSASLCRPSIVADYLYDLAQTYSRFYQNVPFLKAEEGIRESRVRLGMLVASTLKCGLGLLGIETLNRI